MVARRRLSESSRATSTQCLAERPLIPGRSRWPCQDSNLGATDYERISTAGQRHPNAPNRDEIGDSASTPTLPAPLLVACMFGNCSDGHTAG